MDVRHVTEASARIIRVPAALGNPCTRFDVLPILSIKRADVAVQERNWIALVVLEDIRHHYGCPTLRKARNRPVRIRYAVPEVTACSGGPLSSTMSMALWPD